MAADVAPGLLRAEAESKPGAAPAFGFLRWRGHDAALWAALIAEARERRGAGMKRLAAARPGVVIRGSDRDQRAVKVARDFVKRAGLHGLVAIEHAQLESVAAPTERGLLATNAPYGERLDVADTEVVYQQLGERLREAFPGWSAVVLAGDRRQLKAVGLAPKRETDLRNGPLECVLAYYEAGAAPTGAAAPRTARAEARSSSRKAAPPDATGARGRRRRDGRPRRAGARAGGSRRSAQSARRRRRVPGQPVAQEPAPAGQAPAARGHHLLPALRRRPARVQPRRRRVRRVGARPGVRGAARDRPRQGQAAPGRGGRGHRRRPRDAAAARGAQGAPPAARSGAVRAARRRRQAPRGRARTSSRTSST